MSLDLYTRAISGALSEQSLVTYSVKGSEVMCSDRSRRPQVDPSWDNKIEPDSDQVYVGSPRVVRYGKRVQGRLKRGEREQNREHRERK